MRCGWLHNSVLLERQDFKPAALTLGEQAGDKKRGTSGNSGCSVPTGQCYGWSYWQAGICIALAICLPAELYLYPRSAGELAVAVRTSKNGVMNVIGDGVLPVLARHTVAS